MSERLYILDAHSLIYQVFHALPEMTAPDGMPTNAVFGFVRDVEFIRRQKRPDYLLCAFDAPGPTFRHDLDQNYKATRAEMPDDLKVQIEMIRAILAAYRIPVLVESGIEADDFLASVAVQAGRRNIHAYLCTADKDMRQVIGSSTTIYDLRRNRLINREYLLDDWGITPEQVVDYQAMVGDSSDNVRGIKGVGPKTASSLLQKYGTLEAILAHVDEIPGAKLRENLAKGRSTALASRELVRLRTDLALPEDWSIWRVQQPDHDRLLELFGRCGFHRFADELRREAPSTAGAWTAHYHAVTDRATFEALMRQLAGQTRISIDLETTSLRATEAGICGYALSWEPGTAYYVAVRAPDGQTSLDPDEVLQSLRPILENPEIEKVGQNLKYDWIVLQSAGVNLEGIAFDSMVASYLLEPGERNHNLDELSQRLLRHETIKIGEVIGKGKEQRRFDEAPLEKAAQYAGEDADVALRLCGVLEPRLRSEGLHELFVNVELPLIEVLARMEQRGIRIDADVLRAQSRQYAERLRELTAEAHQLAGGEFNLESPTQLRRVLFEDLRLPIVKRTKTGPSTDQDVLEELADRHPLCAVLLEHRKFTKLKNTYLDALPQMVNPRTGRIHASFNQSVAATGRLSSSDPNLQNIPVRTAEGRQIRQAFLPGEGMVLLSADYSQIELRLLAHFSQDAALRQAFLEERDIHAVVAAEVNGILLEQVTSEMRRRAKAVNFGIMYGLSPYGLARQLGIDKQEAARFIDAYFQRYPAIDAFFTEVLARAKKERVVRTILGRKRPISGIKNITGRSRNLAERTAINTVIQGSAADLIKVAMVHLERRLKSEGFAAHLLLQIHDELVFEVDPDQTERLVEMVAAEMTGALALDGVPLKVDVGIGPNWLDLTPVAATPALAAAANGAGNTV